MNDKERASNLGMTLDQFRFLVGDDPAEILLVAKHKGEDGEDGEDGAKKKKENEFKKATKKGSSK